MKGNQKIPHPFPKMPTQLLPCPRTVAETHYEVGGAWAAEEEGQGGSGRDGGRGQAPLRRSARLAMGQGPDADGRVRDTPQSCSRMDKDGGEGMDEDGEGMDEEMEMGGVSGTENSDDDIGFAAYVDPERTKVFSPPCQFYPPPCPFYPPPCPVYSPPCPVYPPPVPDHSTAMPARLRPMLADGEDAGASNGLLNGCNARPRFDKGKINRPQQRRCNRPDYDYFFVQFKTAAACRDGWLAAAAASSALKLSYGGYGVGRV